MVTRWQVSCKWEQVRRTYMLGPTNWKAIRKCFNWPQEMDYWYLLRTCPPECSLPPLCKFPQRWGCSYLGCFLEEMYRTQWTHTCSNMCKMGWRLCYLYRVFLLLNDLNNGVIYTPFKQWF